MIVTDEQVTGLAACPDALCDGHRQAPVAAIRTTTARLYHDIDPSPANPLGPLTEASWVRYQFADPEQAECPYCHKGPRNLDEQVRPVYLPLAATLMRAREAAEKRDGSDIDSHAQRLQDAEKSAKAMTEAGPRPKPTTKEPA